jgi:hypothetical protein
MISRIREAFAIEISLAQAFQYPSMRELAQYIDTLLWAQSTSNQSHNENANSEDREEFEL